MTKLKKPKINREPTISINKLAEYMTANSSRRLTIIKDAKYPSDMKAFRYSQARKDIARYIKAGFDEEILNRGIRNQKDRDQDTDWQKSDVEGSIRALEAAKKIKIPALSNCEASLSNSKRIDIEGVSVSVNADLEFTDSKTNKVGSLKIHISSTGQLSLAQLEYLATILYFKNLEEGLQPNQIDHKICIGVDVFSQKHEMSKRTHKQKMNQVKASCLEIRDRWDAI